MRRDEYAALLEQRNHAFADAQELNEKAERENRNLTADEKKTWDAKMRELQKLNVELEANRPEARSESGNLVEHRPPFASAGVDREIETAIRSIQRGESRALSTAISTSPASSRTSCSTASAPRVWCSRPAFGLSRPRPIRSRTRR